MLCRVAGCSFKAVPGLSNHCPDCYEEHYGNPPPTTHQQWSQDNKPHPTWGGCAQGSRFDEQPPVKMLCRVAGCSFKAVPELNNYCPDCYEEHYGNPPPTTHQQWSQDDKPHPTWGGAPVKMLCRVAGCSFKAVPGLSNYCPDCYEEHYGNPPPTTHQQWSQDDKPHPTWGGAPVKMLCRVAGCSFKAVPGLYNYCPDCYEEHYGNPPPATHQQWSQDNKPDPTWGGGAQGSRFDEQPPVKMLCRVAGCSFKAVPGLYNYCPDCYEEHYGNPPPATHQQWSQDNKPDPTWGGGTQGSRFDEQPPVKMLCRVAGCSFKAVPGLSNYCPDCYEEHYGNPPPATHQQWSQDNKPDPTWGGGTQGSRFDEQPPVKMLCRVAGCSFKAVPGLYNYCPDCYEEHYGNPPPATHQQWSQDDKPHPTWGGGAQGSRFDEQLPVLCRVAGCSFKAELNNFCPDCYEECYGPAFESDQHPPQRPPKPAPRHRKAPLIDGSDTSSIQETNRLQKELRVLNETVTQKDNQVSLLRKENTELLDQIKQQQFTTQRYQGEKEQLQQDNEQLRQQKEQLQQDNKQLQQDNEQLRQQKEQVQQEKEQLRQQLQQQTGRNRQLQKRLDEQRNSQVVEFWKVPPQDVHVFKGEEDILGRGAWGYVAKGRFRGQRVAVKCLHQAILDPRNVERVHREIRTMAQVRHPNLMLFIAAVYEEGRAPMIVTELLNTNLRQAYQRVHITSSNKLSIFRDVSCALNYLHCHREPIIHRDVSAPNVLLEALANDTWKAKVSDFGSANLAALSHTLGEGAIIYSAPETIPQPYNLHALPLPQTPKIDVYSYGILLCEVAAGQFPDPERYSTLVREVQRAWPPMYSLIISCTKYHPNERPSMAQVLDELDRMP